MFRILVVLCFVLAKEGVVSHGHGHGRDFGWDRLTVTFGRFSQMPITENEARKANWTKDASCGGKNFFVGNRYVQGNDKSTRLIFDRNGKIAGIQATISSTVQFPSPWIKASDDEVTLTAYFRDPNCICKKRKTMKKVGDELYIQTKSWHSTRKLREKTIRVPQRERRLKGPVHGKWVRGKCFNGMGMHYWYNISPGLPCDKLFPVFLMFDETSKLRAFGWALNSYVSSPRWMHPTNKHFPLFFDVSTIPMCLYGKDISVQHIYLTDPHTLTCPTAAAPLVKKLMLEM